MPEPLQGPGGATLSVLDLSPVSSGEPVQDAVPTTIDLARRAEAWGYRGFWLAEHHLSAGVAGATPAVLAGIVAGATTTLRVGSAATLLAVTSAAVAAEQFATVARAFGDRVDLGFGRVHTPPPVGAGPPPAPRTGCVVDGLPVPAPPEFSVRDPAIAETLRATSAVLGVHRADAPPLATELRLALDLLDAGHLDPDGRLHSSALLAGAPVTVHVLASSGGESARVAGELGLPLVANYHVVPSEVLATVETYRAAFRPGVLAEPRVAVSADVVVAETEARARELARPYGQWVLSIRRGRGAIPVPSAEEVDAFVWEPADEALVADRLESHVVGTPATVVDRLAALQRVTGADEILVTTTTHRTADRFRSYELLAGAWSGERTRSRSDLVHALPTAAEPVVAGP